MVHRPCMRSHTEEFRVGRASVVVASKTGGQHVVGLSIRRVTVSSPASSQLDQNTLYSNPVEGGICSTLSSEDCEPESPSQSQG